MRAGIPLARQGSFPRQDPKGLSGALALFETAAQKKAQGDDQRSIYALTAKQTGTYNARAWEIARMDPSRAHCFVVLPDPVKNLGVWIGVKFAAAGSIYTVTVSAGTATIDGAATYTLNISRQIVFFYATPDGWERGSTL